VQEIILAQDIENKYSKKEILEMYFNSVYFGEGAFGIENAAHIYFDTSAKHLSLAQAAFLTALLPSPSRFSPYTGDIHQAYRQQKIVLQKMLDQHYITNNQKEKAEKEKLTFHPAPPIMNVTAPHFALMVRDILIKKYGEEYLVRSGIQVTTTLDLNWQKKAENAVANQIKDLQNQHATNGALVAMDPKTGDIKALVGSVDWFNHKFGTINMAITPRSVGSSFKPIVYASAFEERLISPATVLHDQPTNFNGNYAPHDYDYKFRGNVLVRRALANSLNVPAVEVMQKVGVPATIEMAKRLGISTLKDPSNYGLSLVLGSGEVKLLELTNAYTTFANNGVRPDPRMILSISDKHGKTVFTSSVKTSQELSPQVSFLISSILSDNNARREEFGNLLTISRPAAVKTGTAEDYKDSLTVGYTPSLTIGVWVGNNDNSSMDTVAGSLGAAPIWKELMESYLADTPIEHFSPPLGIARASVCPNGSLALDSARTASSNAEYFIPGTQPPTLCLTPDLQPTTTFFSIKSAPSPTPFPSTMLEKRKVLPHPHSEVKVNSSSAENKKF